jgi:elongator complex protein 5
LETLKPLTKKKQNEISVGTSDPTQNLPFNLSLTSSQQESRAQVPLPYAHEGTPITNNSPAAIFYDPDSADDIDDDDPDEDLDI